MPVNKVRIFGNTNGNKKLIHGKKEIAVQSDSRTREKQRKKNQDTEIKKEARRHKEKLKQETKGGTFKICGGGLPMNSDQQMQSEGADEASCYHPLSEFSDHLEILMENLLQSAEQKLQYIT